MWVRSIQSVYATFTYQRHHLLPPPLLSPATVSETCTDITSAHNLFNQAGANYRYYNEGAGKTKDKKQYRFVW